VEASAAGGELVRHHHHHHHHHHLFISGTLPIEKKNSTQTEITQKHTQKAQII